MPTVTLTSTGVQKIAGLYGNGNGATYVTTVTAGTATVKKFDVRRRPIRGGSGNVVGSAGNSQTVTYTETARFDFELEVWVDVSVAGTVVVTQTKSGETDQIHMASYAMDGNYIGGLVAGANGLKLLPQPGAADSMFTSYSALGFDFALASGLTVGTTDLTSSITNDYPRWTGYSRKCVLGATNTSQIRFSQFTPVAPDPDDLALQVEVYIENYVTEFAASNAFIDIELSNSTTTAIGSNYSRWSFNSTGIKQGWNTFKVRSADTVSGTAGAGNLPTGASRPADVGTGFNFAIETCGYFRLTFNNMPSQNVYVDQLRLPPKAKSVLVMGFDASAYGNDDNTFVDKLAPLFAQYGMRGYCTFTDEYELRYSGSTAWERLSSLNNDYGWDVVNHTWSHGAGSVGRNTILTSLVAASDVCTALFPSAHGLPIGSKFRARIRGSSIAVTNVVSEWTVTTTTAATATITSSGTATATGTITINTFLGEVFDSDTAENRRQCLQEFKAAADAMQATGFSRNLGYTVYPNNSYCDKAVMEYAADAAQIKIGRGARGGFTAVTEKGIDNPLCCGSFEMTSGASGTTTSTIAAKVTAAIDRGDHIHIFGHFILDDTDTSLSAYWPLAGNNGEYPPANNGNPNPPSASLSSTGGWWYLSQLEKLFSDTIGPALADGTLVAMTPSEYVAYMGYK